MSYIFITPHKGLQVYISKLGIGLDPFADLSTSISTTIDGWY